MSGNTIEYLIRLKDEFTAKMQAAAGVGAKGGAAIAQGMAVAVAAGLKFKDQISAGWDVLNGNYEALGTVLGALPGPLGEIGQIAGETLGKMIKETEEAAEGYRKLSAATGASVEFLSGFKEAADDVRVSGEAVDAALIKFSRGLGGVKDASEGVAENGKGIAATLKDIGVNANDSEGKVRPLADLLPDVADAFSKMADGPAKTALAIQLFGKQGAELIPILNKGKEGIAEMAKAAEEAGLTMSGETVAAVDKLKVAQDALGDAAGAFARRVGGMVIPALAEFIKYMNYLTGVGDAQVDAFHKAENAISEFNSTGKLSAETLAKLREGGTTMAAELTKQVDAERKVSEGYGWMAAGTVKNIDTMKQLYPEIFNVTEVTDKSAVAATELGDAQKKVAEGSVEYKDRTQQLTDAMSKRDDQLDDIKQKESDLADAYKKGFITADQYSQGQLHLMDATAKVKDEFDKAAVKIHDGAEATEKMDKAAQGAADRERIFEQATRDAAAAQEVLKDKLDGLTAGIGGLPQKLDAAAKAQLAWKLATGQMTVQDMESKAVGEALTQQYANRKITLKELIDIGTAYKNGEISAAAALEKAGALTNVSQVNQLKTYREIEQASGQANKSELGYIDTLRIAGGSYRTYTSDAKTLAQAQINASDSSKDIHKNLELIQTAEKNGTITRLQSAEAQVYLNQQLGVVSDNLRKAEVAYNNGQPVIRSWAKVVSESGLSVEEWEAQMRALGLTTEQVNQVVTEVKNNSPINMEVTADPAPVKGVTDGVHELKEETKDPATVTTRSDTSGLDEGTPRVQSWKTETEKPVIIPVGMEIEDPTARSVSDQMHAALLGGGDKTGKAVSVTVPVAVKIDTSSVDADIKPVVEALSKLGDKHVAVILDTVGFDTSVANVKSQLSGLPDENISISISVPDNVNLPDFSGLTGKNVSLTSDVSDILTDVSAAQKAIDGLTGKTVDLKLNSSGNVSLPSNSTITVSVVGDTADATKDIQTVIDTVIPEKTAFINGDSLGAMTILDAVNDAKVDSKTLIIEGAHKAALGTEVGSGGKTFAMDAISEVNAAYIPLKTVVIAGNNQHAMQAISSTKVAMEALKDRTIFVNVVRNDIPTGDNGNGGGGNDNNGKDNRVPNNALRGTNGTVIYLAQNLYVRDELDLAKLQAFIDTRLAERLNR